MNRFAWITVGLFRAAALWTGMLLWDAARADVPTFESALVRLAVYVALMLAFTRWQVRQGRRAPRLVSRSPWRRAPRLVSRSPFWRLVFDPPAWLRAGLGQGVGFFALMTLLALHDGATVTLPGSIVRLAVYLACWTGVEYARTRPWQRLRAA